LSTTEPVDVRWPEGFGPVALAMPGVLVVQGPAYDTHRGAAEALGASLADQGKLDGPQTGWPLVVLVDDAEFVSRTLDNFLWVTFTRSNPSHDVHGVGSTIVHKHWGCRGAVIIDARLKPHHAPPLTVDPVTTRAVDELAARGGPLHGIV